ncbi:sortase B protein-sorting domain-containing protein [Gracilibacillus salitolerans]|uniref:Sortase B protein-sorting domain-containing protein n=1 Tax=Gracilibacillus salitolerans TaxID=2663022 RepID=A0A5Q2TGL4_9BACI|nr:sortase B protein-sorting domain-containing protein [Gracilibacillus salitolerans]QGH33163.1 sortase B protein-sorting domain-containing protein [Gracilibacillus salitolerans]
MVCPTYQVAYDEDGLRVVVANDEETDNNSPDETDGTHDNDKSSDVSANDGEENEENTKTKDDKDHSKDVEAEDNSIEEETATVKNPKTGDETNLALYVGLLLASVIAIAGVFLIRRVRKQSV